MTTTETIETGLDMDEHIDDIPAPRRLQGRAGLVVPLLAAVALAAALVGAVWTGLDVRDEQRSDDRERSALAAGREAAVAFTSYDYRRIEQDLDRVSAMSTGTFRDEFATALGALTDAITKAEGVSEGTVNQAGVVRMHADSAVVIAAVDATITNKETREPSLRRYRLQTTLTRDGGDWLISEIKPVA